MSSCVDRNVCISMATMLEAVMMCRGGGRLWNEEHLSLYTKIMLMRRFHKLGLLKIISSGLSLPVFDVVDNKAGRTGIASYWLILWCCCKYVRFCELNASM